MLLSMAHVIVSILFIPTCFSFGRRDLDKLSLMSISSKIVLHHIEPNLPRKFFKNSEFWDIFSLGHIIDSTNLILDFVSN